MHWTAALRDVVLAARCPGCGADGSWLCVSCRACRGPGMPDSGARAVRIHAGAVDE